MTIEQLNKGNTIRSNIRIAKDGIEEIEQRSPFYSGVIKVTDKEPYYEEIKALLLYKRKQWLGQLENEFNQL